MEEVSENILVIKRDGSEVDFDIVKVQLALYKAFCEARPNNNKNAMRNSANAVSYHVYVDILNDEFGEIEVEEIQEIVKDKLLRWKGLEDVAKEYIEYATTRKNSRDWEQNLISNVKGLLNKDETVMNENANKDSRIFNTLRDLTAGSVAKAVGLNLLPPNVKDAHIKGEVYQHDLDYFPYSPMTNCSLPDFDFMLSNGFALGNAQLSSPK